MRTLLLVTLSLLTTTLYNTSNCHKLPQKPQSSLVTEQDRIKTKIVLLEIAAEEALKGLSQEDFDKADAWWRSDDEDSVKAYGKYTKAIATVATIKERIAKLEALYAALPA